MTYLFESSVRLQSPFVAPTRTRPIRRTVSGSATAATSDRLIRAAEELIGERGIGNVSVRDITSRARANTAAINYYFGTKEGLTAWLARRVGAQLAPAELADMVSDFLVAAFEAPA